MARMPRPRLALLIVGCLMLIPLEGLTANNTAQFAFGFRRPVFVTSSSTFQAAEPSIRVDATDPNHRIWIAAPTGVGADRRGLPGGSTGPGGGDLFWYSDNDGATWTVVNAPGPTIVGGGDSDVVAGPGPQVFGTGLTLANITLAGSCDNGVTFSTNPFSTIGAVEDRQWIDMYEDRAKPLTGPDLVLTYGGFAEGKIYFHQVLAPCVPPAPPTPPEAGTRFDATYPFLGIPSAADTYQWPGNITIDENTGDVYIAYNTSGNPANDKIIVTRIDNGAELPTNPATDIHPIVAATNRPDTFDSFVVAAVDSASNVYVVWSERIPSEQGTNTMLAVSTDRGDTWKGPFTVNQLPETHTTVFPWIVAGAAGRIDIVYYATSASGSSPETVPNSSMWRVWLARSLDATADTPTFREGPATGFMHQGSICTSGTGCATGTRDLLDFFMNDIDERGLANITYTDNLNTPLTGTDHQEWITFVHECRITSRRTSIPCSPPDS